MRDEPQKSAKRALVSQEACEWFIRLRDDQLSSRLRRRHVQWLKQSPDHIAELLRAQQIHKLLRETPLHDRPTSAPEAGGSYNVVELMPRAVRPAPTATRARIQPWKAAAAVAALALPLLLGLFGKAEFFDRTITTELGEWRTVTLSDQTKVRVGPGSKLRVSFGDAHRTVRLIRGEAMFDVAKDPARPFLVASELLSVLAIGTEFRVSRQDGNDIVAVTEGAVAVYDEGTQRIQGPLREPPATLAAATGGIALTAGEQVSVSKLGPASKQTVNLDYERAWADGWLTFENRTLAEVAGEFNRRNRVQIVLEDAAVSGRRLAFFRGRATDPESFVAALATDSTVSIERDASGRLRVRSTPESIARQVAIEGASSESQ